MSANLTIVGASQLPEHIPEHAELYAAARAMVPTLLELGARTAADRICMVTESGWLFDNATLNIVFRDTTAGSTHRAMNFDANAKNYTRSLGLRWP